MSTRGQPFFLGLCVKALPAADLESFAVRPSNRVREAAVPALLEVSLFGARVCDSALPPADLDARPVEGLVNVLEALVAADLDVTSLLAIKAPLLLRH